jgi:hypothetical protein
MATGPPKVLAVPIFYSKKKGEVKILVLSPIEVATLNSAHQGSQLIEEMPPLQYS